MGFGSPSENRDSHDHIGMKIIDKISVAEQPFVTFEFFPPKTEIGMSNLYKRMKSLCSVNPLWIDVTWGAGGSTSETTFDVCSLALHEYGLDVMIHLTCTNMKVNLLDEALAKFKKAGLRNIMALRGDPPANAKEWKQIEGGFSHAADLVRHIRKNYGNWFCIGVAGYPEGHTECTSFGDDLQHLKEKVDAGADLIITQLFYDNELFKNYIERVRGMGISVPILPGIMPVTTYSGFTKMTSFCQTFVPEQLRARIEAVKENDEAVRKLGIEVAVEMCADLIMYGVIGLHFYTMNSEENIREILKKLKSFLPNAHCDEIVDDEEVEDTLVREEPTKRVYAAI